MPESMSVRAEATRAAQSCHGERLQERRMRTPSSFETRDTLLDSFQRERSGYDDGDVVRDSRHAAGTRVVLS